MIVSFKEYSIFLQVIKNYKDIHHKLWNVFDYVTGLYGCDFSQNEIVITSIIRYDDPNSPHYYGRAMDIRTHSLSVTQQQDLERMINETFDYGKTGYHVALVHGEGYNRHLHVQVRNETERKKQAEIAEKIG